MYRIQGPKHIIVFVTNRSSCCQSCGDFFLREQKGKQKTLYSLGSHLSYPLKTEVELLE